MKELNEQDIILVMREEWSKKVKSLMENVNLVYRAKLDGHEINPLSSGLKVRAKIKKSGKACEECKGKGCDACSQSRSSIEEPTKAQSHISYIIDSIGPDSVSLRNPEGETITISTSDLEKNYELDT